MVPARAELVLSHPRTRSEMPQLSIITAFYDEGENISSFRERLTAVMSEQGTAYEVVLVDDHSSKAANVFGKFVLSDLRF